MSVYNHRPMVPAPQNRILEMLETIRNDFEQLSQELYVCKTQRDDFEHKMNQQISEMNSFQQSLLELERTQQNQKKQYEDEISRLRQQIETRMPSGSSTIPLHPIPPPPTPQQQQPPSQAPHQPPPTIGPGSNYFGGIMNAHTQGPPGLVAPPIPEQSPAQPSPHYAAYLNGSQYGRGIPTPPSSGHPQRPEWGNYGYRPGPSVPPSSEAKRKSNASTSSAPPSQIQHHQLKQQLLQKQQPQPQVALSRPPSVNKIASPSLSASGHLADVDPENVPANMKVEGQDWFALFNPKAPRQLKVNLVQTMEHKSVVCCVKFSADGRLLAAGCNRTTLIYDAQTASRVAVLQDESIKTEGDLYIRSVCFSPDNNFLATGAEDMKIRVWDITNNRIRNILSGHEQDIYSLDFSRDGRLIASGSGDCTARIWSTESGKCLQVLRITDHDQKDPGVTSVAFSPDGRIIAAASLDKMIRIWDTQTGALLERLEGHKDSVYSVAFMPDGKMLVSGSLDKTLKLWQLGTSEGRGMGIDRDRGKGPCKVTFTGHKDFVLSVGCTPDGRWVVSGSKDRGVQFWDPKTGQTQFMLQGHKNSVISVAISPSGKPLFATGSGDNRARIWSYDSINTTY
ncbi:WD40-repeat-containing domain protein [Sporodiniella umbellata]|nr:WD40-repeat-containing domain protein [Sporodiniella umbellata]